MLYTNSRTQGILEGKDVQAQDMPFPLVEAFVDRATGNEPDYPTILGSRETLSKLEQ